MERRLNSGIMLSLVNVLATLVRFRARASVALLCVWATLLLANLASANVGVQAKTSVWDFESASALNVCSISSASSEQHREIRSCSAGFASESPHAARGVTVKPGKWDYFFGRVTSNPHNQARSLQNLRDLRTLGFDEAAGGRNALTKLFQESQRLPEAARHVTEHGITVTRTARVGDVGAIDIKYFYPGGNMSAAPEVSTIIPKVFR